MFSVASVTAVVCTLLAAVTAARPELVVGLLLAPAAVLLVTVDFAVVSLPVRPGRRRRRYAAASCRRRASTLLGSGKLAG
jgi:hypothetical protein